MRPKTTATKPALIAALIIFGTTAPPAHAAKSYPMVMGLKPVAVQVGSTVEAAVQAVYSMDGTKRVLVSGRGVTAEPVATHSTPTQANSARKKKASEQQGLPVRIHVAADAIPGIRDFRLTGAYGASTVGQLVVVRDPVFLEKGENNTPEKAQPITLPAAMCGTIESAEDRDYFRFHADAGRSLVFHVYGMQLENRIHDLQTHLDPILTLRGSNGAIVAVCDNDISGDPLLCHRFKAGGDYTLEIRDVRFKGDSNWVYCIEINDRPFARAVYPLAVTPGRRVAFLPIGLATGGGRPFDWTPPADWRNGLHEVALPLADGKLNPVSLVSSNLPIVLEDPLPAGTSAGSKQTRKRQSISVPAGVNGRLLSEAETDVYSFIAKKGETSTFEVVARRCGSPLDAIVRLTDGRGRTLAESDDLSDHGRNFADAQIESWRAPADGTYQIEIRDLLRRGGTAFVYFLKVERASPGFELTLDTDKTELSPGTVGVMYVNSLRKHGFQGEIALSVEGLPAGVSALCGRIPPDHRDGCIMLKAAANAKVEAANIVVTGTGKGSGADGKPAEIRSAAVPLQETYLPGGGRGHWPVETHTVAVGVPGDLRAVRLDKQEITLAPGQSVRVNVTIERAPGFKDNVTLGPRLEHLGRVYGDTLPKGVAVDLAKSKTLLTGVETKGWLTFHATPAAEPAKKRPVAVMANLSINFVMKATYSSDPLFVTTTGKK